MDQDSNDLASSGFGNTLTRDGQGQPTTNLPMNNFRHTGVANAVNRTDYAAFGQLQDGQISWTLGGGAADAIIANYTPSVATLTDGLLRAFRAAAANATTTPTFQMDGLTAHTITRMGGAALIAGDIPGALAECWVRYNLTNTRWELLNPAQPQNGPTITGTATFTTTGVMNVPAGTTVQRPGSPSQAAMRFNTTTAAFEGFDGASWRNLNAPNGNAPNVQSFTSGTSATYTTPTGALYLVVEMVGGGGGGGGSSNGGSPTAGGNGGSTTFNSITASGGGGGAAASTQTGGGGGSQGSGGTGSAAYRFQGAAGNPGNTAAASVVMAGGAGANSFFGGGGSAGSNAAAGTGQPNTGAGGGGGGSAVANIGSAGGGGAGEYARLVIASPAATYTYTVGTAGGAGSGSTNGGAGAAGVIIVTAYYQ